MGVVVCDSILNLHFVLLTSRIGEGYFYDVLDASYVSLILSYGRVDLLSVRCKPIMGSLEDHLSVFGRKCMVGSLMSTFVSLRITLVRETSREMSSL